MDYRLRLALFCPIVVIFLQLQATTANDRNIELNSFQALAIDDSWVDWDTLRLKKKTRMEMGLTGDVNIKQNLGNEQLVSLQIHKHDRENNRRGPLVFQTQKPFCKLVESLKSTYDGMVEASNLPKKFECPFPKNTYTYKDYVLDTNDLVKDIPNGDYIIEAVLKHNGKPVSVMLVDVTVSN
ncbi:uncharacterized protein LOC105223565 [Bactrocera dorsalis]|uniref:Uncharacterized protein LOC105223565 n=1 Tax=Bactrocera dorsalis TaxID=27457 RepID=A0A6I9V9U1_BACDO|nr:uncharacterized protein LOC105223565 [Bactrocera dorsalis]